MRRMAVVLSMLLIAAVPFAAQAAQKKPTPAKPATPAMHKTHVVEAEVVSADAMAKTPTVKSAAGTQTMKVDAEAASHLKDLTSGEKVRLTCRDNEKGEHQAISQIVVEKSPARK